MMKKFVFFFVVSFVLLSAFAPSATLAQDSVKPVEVGVSKIKADERAALRAELEAIHESDQQHRKLMGSVKTPEEMTALWGKQNLIDAANQTRVEEIIKQYGWPGQTEFGAKAAQAAFLVLQHAALEIQKRHFLTLQQAMESGELRKADFALFDDRIRIREGRPQLYGSQVANNRMSFQPIEDEVNVDKRRAAMDLQPLAQYAKLFGFEYTPVAERTQSTSVTDKPLASEAKK
jgi:hypothetical protein